MLQTLINSAGADLEADLDVPRTARAIVVFAHGAGSSRLSPRNRMVADALRRSGHLGTLLFDLLTREEDTRYANRFEIGLLSERLLGALDWLASQEDTRGLPVGLFGASTGAAAALVAGVERPYVVRAIVSRGGRPDLAPNALPEVRVPVMFIVGGHDYQVIEMNQQAFDLLGTDDKCFEIVPGATHLFEEPGALEEVAALSVDWFERKLVRAVAPR